MEENCPNNSDITANTSTLSLSSTSASGGGAISKPLKNAEHDKEDPATALAIWTEDVVVLDPGTVRFPIRVVVVDNNFHTRFDRLVKLPKDCTTSIYRILDHGIPWQHLEAGLTLEEVKSQLVTLAKGKRLVMYDAWKTIGLFDFSEQQLSRLKIFDLKTSTNSIGADGEPLSYWNLALAKLGHNYTGKPGNYDTIELTDFVMSIYLKYQQEELGEYENSTLKIVDQLQLTSRSNGLV